MNWENIGTILTGLATAIPLVIALVNFIIKAYKEKNWSKLLGLAISYMEEAEQKFEDGATRKEWVMAMLMNSAEYIQYPIDKEALSELIDELIAMTNKINVDKEESNDGTATETESN